MTDSAEETTELYITFTLADEMFAIDVRQVREILDTTTITRIPHAPEFLRGVINVRGSVVPVVDMRLKFGMDALERTAKTRIVVLELESDDETLVLGAMTDTVRDVIELDDTEVDAPPKIGARWRSDYIRGIGKYGNDFIIILDIHRIFSSSELAFVDSMSVEESGME